MASNILKNNSFGGPTYFDRRWATCLGAVDKRAELGWPSSRGKGLPAVCKSGPRLCKSTVLKLIETITHVCDKMEFIFVSLDTRADSLSLFSLYILF